MLKACALATSAGTEDRDDLTGAHRDGDALDGELALGRVVGDRDIAGLADGRFGHGGHRDIPSLKR
jgi:hypothetical protein